MPVGQSIGPQSIEKVSANSILWSHENLLIYTYPTHKSNNQKPYALQFSAMQNFILPPDETCKPDAKTFMQSENIILTHHLAIINIHQLAAIEPSFTHHGDSLANNMNQY